MFKSFKGKIDSKKKSFKIFLIELKKNLSMKKLINFISLNIFNPNPPSRYLSSRNYSRRLKKYFSVITRRKSFNDNLST